jgi:hypothetical protein
VRNEVIVFDHLRQIAGSIRAGFLIHQKPCTQAVRNHKQSRKGKIMQNNERQDEMRKIFVKSEVVIKLCQDAFFIIGEILDFFEKNQLAQMMGYSNLEDYCASRWCWDGMMKNQLIGASRVVELLPGIDIDFVQAAEISRLIYPPDSKNNDPEEKRRTVQGLASQLDLQHIHRRDLAIIVDDILFNQGSAAKPRIYPEVAVLNISSDAKTAMDLELERLLVGNVIHLFPGDSQLGGIHCEPKMDSKPELPYQDVSFATGLCKMPKGVDPEWMEELLAEISRVVHSRILFVGDFVPVDEFKCFQTCQAFHLQRTIIYQESGRLERPMILSVFEF